MYRIIAFIAGSKRNGEKETGQRSIGIYQEVNMVFNFSDKLAQAIEPTAIAEITLEEAMHLIEIE